MSFEGFFQLPAHGMAAVILLVLYVIEAEIRFGAKARTHATGSSDRGSTIAVGLSSAIPVAGFVIAMRGASSSLTALPAWLRAQDSMPGMPAVAWAGLALGFAGLLLRLWALLTLRHRYTRTLRIDEGHDFERGGPYRFIRHPGYLGSLLALNAIGLASGNAIVFAASLVATWAAYAHRIRAEDAMLVAAFGAPYEAYRRETGALLPRGPAS